MAFLIDRDGKIYDLGSVPHEVAIKGLADYEDVDEAILDGWIRGGLDFGNPRGIMVGRLYMEGLPHQIERYKFDIDRWASEQRGYEIVEMEDALRGIIWTGDRDEFLSRDAKTLLHRAKMMQTYYRRPPDEQVFVRTHKRKKIGVYPGGRYYRERLLDPSKCQPGTMRTKDIGAPGGHKAIVCRPRGKKTTRVQSLLHPRTERERRKLGLPKRIRKR